MPDLLTLLIPYRQREKALVSFCEWSIDARNSKACPQIRVILIEGSSTPTENVAAIAAKAGIEYYFVKNEGVFHKTRLLNFGLKLVSSNYVLAYDVDLIPYGNSLLRHLHLTQSSSHFLVTGYRLMCDRPSLIDNNLDEECDRSSIAPEDMPTALKKHLTSFEKFGVLPMFETKLLQQLGGWDENFLGWGGEDQDLIERYSRLGFTLCRVPELVYLHLNHDREPDWYSSEILTRNRSYYYSKNSQIHQWKKSKI
jgi:predicted glycosyltransferase involved in capsule biosynthesis